MSKKVKCIECLHHMYYAIPMSDGVLDNGKRVNKCVISQSDIACSLSMKSKKINSESYCKHFMYVHNAPPLTAPLFIAVEK